MNFLRTLSIRDVGTALKRREFGLALRIGQNLCSNAIGTAREPFATHAPRHKPSARYEVLRDRRGRLDPRASS